ncbi:uncharacterized protein TRAVEDRAFT_70993 [Trametes versicolor FP-101664 SS1]|uniref:uncharacterized protein n=1 Tax=Trametes versicolor (strain FP-101664) TaxID=717944 RepID=UPI0004623CA8|nr:uncharacterized protein TRAVEDRAFT_70993 [Trametes versicolor FP-101664 SS1]EIW60675.1 hypothetical protein TRAVEDRAFT_70993 [Trametes versicolor FP-101664 SS1]
MWKADSLDVLPGFLQPSTGCAHHSRLGRLDGRRKSQSPVCCFQSDVATRAVPCSSSTTRTTGRVSRQEKTTRQALREWARRMHDFAHALPALTAHAASFRAQTCAGTSPPPSVPAHFRGDTRRSRGPLIDIQYASSKVTHLDPRCPGRLHLAACGASRRHRDLPLFDGRTQEHAAASSRRRR